MLVPFTSHHKSYLLGKKKRHSSVMKFFRIITSNITAKSKLKLPSKFVKRYNVPRNARLRVPTGANWRVEVKKNSGGVWLGKGWVQFAESLGVKYGHFLVFDYDATRAVFHVVAIGMNAIETKYPAVSSVDDDDEEDQGGPQFKRPKIEDDRAVMMLENGADLGERSDKARSPCFELSGKSARASKASDIEAEKICGNGPVASAEEKVEPDQTTVKRETFGREITLNREGRIHCVVQGRRGRNQTNDRTEKALQRAKAFKSEEPACIIALQPSYVRQEPLDGRFNKNCQLLFPLSFVEAYFNLEVKDITLRTSNGRTWSVNYRLAGRHQSYFAYGWKRFSVDNDLKVGDVCLFELIRGAENALKVVIFRAMHEDEAPK